MSAIPDWRALGWHANQTMAQALAAAARDHPNSEMIFWSKTETKSTRFGEMYKQSSRIAAAFQELGLGPGDVIAIQVANNLEGALATLAVMLLGATVLPIVQVYGPTETSHVLRESEARAFIVPDRWGSIDYLERIAKLEHCPNLQYRVVIGASAPEGAILWRDLMAYDRPDTMYGAVSADSVAVLLYTSGTTAAPKGVQHSHNTFLAEVRTATTPEQICGQVLLSPWPVGHVAGLRDLMRMCVGGATGVSMDRWDATSAAMLIERYSVTSTAGAPVMLSELLDLEASGSCNLSSLRSYMTGAANVPPSLVTRAERAGIRAFRCYGLSEHPTISSGIVDDPLERRSSTDGRLIDGSQVRILSETDEDLRFGQVGDIVSRGPELFVGYRDPRLNDAAFLSGGWFRTGDMGYMDAEGFLTVTDRRKDIIIRGGENISSMEVEDLLAQVPGVAEAAVVPIPHARLGESVCAYIITRPDAQVTLEAVIEHFRNAGVARQKTPERLEVVDAFPRTAAGKVKKFELRDRLR